MTDDEIRTLAHANIQAAGIAYGLAARILEASPPTTKRATAKAAEELQNAAQEYSRRGYGLIAECLDSIATGLETKGPPAEQ